jgi:hypothetical protein
MLPVEPPDLPPLILDHESSLHTVQVNVADVEKILNSLKVRKSTGSDNISNMLLKSCSISIAQPLTRLFQHCLDSGKFPDSWKLANVTPVFKRGNKQDKNNYRPISLLPNIGKIFERTVYITLYKHFLDNKLLTWRNSGYKKMDSTMNQLIHISHDIYTAFEKGQDVCLVSLDATSAFDRVWHSGLIHKLRQKGIMGPLLEFLQSYLTNRKQRVVLKGQCSDYVNISAGVPQGSILGPLLFLVYVDDIVKDIDSNIYLFADDTSLVEHITDPVLTFQKINADLSKLSQWSKSWLITFNPSKTAYVIFSKKLIKPQYPDLFLENEKINLKNEHKQLGVLFNSKMTFDNHIDQQCKKAMTRVTALKRIKYKIPRSSQLKIYLTFIRPVLEYGWQLYENSSEKSLKKLETVQREALLISTRAYQHTSNVSLQKETGVQTLKSRRKYYKTLFMHKHANNKIPEYLSRLIPETVQERTPYLLRNAANISTPSTSKNYLLKSFIPSSIRTWNSININLRNIESFNSFRNKMRDLYGNPTNPMFMQGDNNGAVNHARIRMGLSGLNAHRKKVNFIQSSECNYCAFKNEDAIHFLFYCPAFAIDRITLLQSLRTITGITLPNLQNCTRQEIVAFLAILLQGKNNIDFDSKIFQYVQNYIGSTKRFM